MQAGLFGKMPRHGDFVTRRLPDAFVEPWDAWLQRCLSASQTMLGSHWADAYLHSPIWRFVIPRGVLGESAWAGVMMSSVDRVGRYFPLTVAVPLHTDISPLDFLASGEIVREWFIQIEDATLGALGDTPLSCDELVALVDRVGLYRPLQLMTAPVTSVEASTRQFGRAWVARGTDRSAAELLAAEVLVSLPDRAFVRCAWYVPGGDDRDSMLVTTDGLPGPDIFVALLQGESVVNLAESAHSGPQFATALALATPPSSMGVTPTAAAPPPWSLEDFDAVPASPPATAASVASVAAGPKPGEVEVEDTVPTHDIAPALDTVNAEGEPNEAHATEALSEADSLESQLDDMFDSLMARKRGQEET